MASYVFFLVGFALLVINSYLSKKKKKFINHLHKLNRRHATWVEFLQVYNFTIKHKAGVLMKIKAQRIRGARAFTTYIGNSILIMENSDLGGCETLETPNIFLFPSVLSLLLF